MKRIQRGPVRGISFALQEQQRELRESYVPSKSALDVKRLTVDPTTFEMIQNLEIDFTNIKVVNSKQSYGRRRRYHE